MNEKQTEQKRSTKSPAAKGGEVKSPLTLRGRRNLMTSRARAGKLREVVKEMKVVTAVADQIVALANKQQPKSTATESSPSQLGRSEEYFVSEVFKGLRRRPR